MPARGPSTHRGFSLIELLIVVAILGMIAVIAIPNLINTIQRSRQRRTMAERRDFGEALEMYQQDNNIYPWAAGAVPADVLRPFLSVYIRNITLVDAWQQPLLYSSNGTRYTVVSYAANGAADLPYTNGPTQRFVSDIVLSGGTFVQWPEGVQY